MVSDAILYLQIIIIHDALPIETRINRVRKISGGVFVIIIRYSYPYAYMCKYVGIYNLYLGIYVYVGIYNIYVCMGIS